MFLILGASWRLPFVRCSAGTGWYVLRAVFISGKTDEIGARELMANCIYAEGYG